MQAESDNPLYHRISRLKEARQWTWKEVALAIGVSVPMLMMVKSNRRGFSGNSLFRLRRAELEAGLTSEGFQGIKSSDDYKSWPKPIIGPSVELSFESEIDALARDIRSVMEAVALIEARISKLRNINRGSDSATP